MHERYKYTTFKCVECGGNVVFDVIKEESYCLECGLVREPALDDKDVES